MLTKSSSSDANAGSLPKWRRGSSVSAAHPPSAGERIRGVGRSINIYSGELDGAAEDARQRGARIWGSLPRWSKPSPSAILLILVGIVVGHFLPSLSRISLAHTPSHLVPPSRFLPPPPHRLNPPQYPEPLALSPRDLRAGRVVPKVVHYVYGLKEPEHAASWDQGLGDEFPYYAYLAIRSVIVNVKPEKIYFHYAYLPTGPWFELLTPHLELVRTVVSEQIYGKRLDHFAHKADIIRLEAMLHTGGIYMDIDMFALRSFDDLLYHPTTLGMEASPDSRRTELDPTGLCNAVIISAPHASFIERWRASYETFSEGEWAQHSVEEPWAIARRYPTEIQVLDTRAFFWPMWHGSEVQKVHETDEYDFSASGQYAYHAWESLAASYLSQLSPARIREVNVSFNRMLRAFIGERDDEVYARWKAGKEG